MAFYNRHQDNELSDNVTALEKKYAGRKQGESDVRIFPVHVLKGFEGEPLKLLKSPNAVHNVIQDSKQKLLLATHPQATMEEIRH